MIMRNNGLIPSTILLLFIYLALLGVIYKLLENLIDPYLKNKICLFLFIFSILLIPLALAALVATRCVAPSGLRLRKFQVGMHRWIGKIYRWLGTGWRSSSVILADVVIVFAFIKGVLYIITDQLQEQVFFGSTIYNASVNGTTSAGTNFSWTINNATVNGSLPYLNLNETAFQGFLLEIGARDGVGFLAYFLALILETVSQDWETIAALWILVLIAKIASDASQRLVVEEVTDYSQDETAPESEGKQKSNKDAVGLSDLLVVHINRINELYMAVDDKRVIPSESGAGRPIDANIKTEDLSDFLSSEAVGGSSEVSFFGMKIPAGAITGFFGRMIRGPRIVISLHKVDEEGENGRVILTATMTRNKKSRSWRVDSLEPLDEREAGKIRTKDDMVKELATRIVHSFSDETSARWKAWYHFNEGLRSYRDGLVSTKKRRYNLKMAEKSFIRALEEANDFALAYYNLGVVYTELRQEEAAEVAFSKAIGNNPELNAAYYALGFNLFTRAEARLEGLEMIFVEPPGFEPPHEPSCKELFWRQGQIFDSAKKSGMDQDDIEHQKEILNNYYSDVVRLCDQAILIAKSKSSFMDRHFNVLAEAYNLKANAQVRRYMLESGDRKDKKPDYLESAEAAVKYSWKALFKAEFENEMVLKCKKTVRECSIDFADLCLYYYSIHKYFYILYEKDPRIYNAEKALKHALFVDPTDANIYFILGKLYYCTSDFVKSAEAYKKAVQVAPDNCDFWAHLALAYARDDNRSGALSSSEKVKVYEQDASYQAIEVTALAHLVLIKKIYEQLKNKLEPENKTKKLLDEKMELKEHKLELWESCNSKMRASLLAKLDLYLLDDSKGDARCILEKIHFIRTYLESPRLVSCKRYDGWTYAQFVIALACLCSKLKEENLHLLKEDDRKLGFHPYNLCDNEYMKEKLQDAISCLEKTSDGNECKWMCLNKQSMFICGVDYLDLSGLVWSWLNEQNILALGLLYYFSFLLLDQTEYERAFNQFRKVKDNIEHKASKNDCEGYSTERSYILIKLGKIYLEHKIFEDAEDCFKNALQMLEIDHPQMMIREQLRLQLAEAFREQKKKSSALKEARKSQICNPINERLGEVTGDIYCDLEKYRIALEEYYGALVWEPDDPEILIKIGRCYLERAAVCRKPADRERSLKKANLHFEHAWELYDKDNLKKRTEARYLMAKTYMELCDYDGALPHLKVIYNSMRSKKEITPKVLIVGITLGQTYLKTKYYNNCEEIFSEIIKMGKHYMNDPKNKSQKFDDLKEYSIDKMSLAGIMVRAYIGLASSFAERNTAICLDKALKKVQKSECHINRLKSGDEMTKCLAMSTDCEGWIRYKQHRICNKKMEEKIRQGYKDFIYLTYCQNISIEFDLECKDLVDISIMLLESAVSIRAESRAYLHLASAYKAKSEIKTEPERNNLLQRAKGCWKLARDLDIKGEYDEELKDLEKDLGI